MSSPQTSGVSCTLACTTANGHPSFGGCSSGIGLYIALHLVRRGAKVYLAARSEEKAAHAIARMENEGLGEHPGELVWLPIDLTDPHKAKAAAEWFIKRENKLDILGA